MLSTSCGLILFILASTPSIITNGLESFNVPCPRTRIVAPSLPGRPPLPAVTETPGAIPASPAESEVIGRLSTILLISTEATAPVIFTFFCVPYPTTTTSSKACESSFSRTVKEVFPFTGIAWSI